MNKLSVESFYIIRVFQPLLNRKIIAACVCGGRWKIQYCGDWNYFDLSEQLKKVKT